MYEDNQPPSNIGLQLLEAQNINMYALLHLSLYSRKWEIFGIFSRPGHNRLSSSLKGTALSRTVMCLKGKSLQNRLLYLLILNCDLFKGKVNLKLIILLSYIKLQIVYSLLGQFLYGLFFWLKGTVTCNSRLYKGKVNL